MTGGYCSRCRVSWPPGATHECRIKLTAPVVTHWDSPEGQTRSGPNCDVLAAENDKLRRELEYAKALAAESKELADSEFRLLEAENAKLRAENHEARKMALTQASDDELWGQPVEQTRWELRRLIQAVLRPLALAEAEEQK